MRQSAVSAPASLKLALSAQHPTTDDPVARWLGGLETVRVPLPPISKSSLKVRATDGPNAEAVAFATFGVTVTCGVASARRDRLQAMRACAFVPSHTAA